ncbi:hypothetical protein NDU88_002556 [Pleurodeles waltl]|uniref:Uncharacterized protein n=1 Tax=Pleurodeles waltl TaxID=8319 RepID=A0AAV7KTZ7_PLEWA|nr:hypothetical protein NDU88_002556 [Pleurodeles waltl]
MSVSPPALWNTDLQEVNAVVLLGIFVVYSQPPCRVGLCRRGFPGSVEGSRTDMQQADLRQLSWLLGSQRYEKLRTGRREQVKVMAPKKSSSNQLKPGAGERRLPDFLPLGLASNAGNAGKKIALKTQGAMDNKQSAPTVDGGSGSGIGAKSFGYHGGGLIIPEMFKNPQPIVHPLPLARRMIMATSLTQSQEMVECGESSGNLVSSTRSTTLS